MGKICQLFVSSIVGLTGDVFKIKSLPEPNESEENNAKQILSKYFIKDAINSLFLKIKENTADTLADLIVDNKLTFFEITTDNIKALQDLLDNPPKSKKFQQELKDLPLCSRHLLI